MNPLCKRFQIEGKVQGVWFRANTKSVAESLGLTGWVKNTSDGKVEVLACGADAQLNDLEAWLQKGPEGAVVKHVSKTDVPYEEFVHFVIRY